jgi:hypothetical protein
MAGLRFFNYDRLGYIPRDCWEECELEPVGKESPSAKSKNRRRRAPSGYLEDRRALTPEEELLAKEALENDADVVEIGKKITFKEFGHGIFKPLESKLEFSLAAAAKLAQILGYTKEELLGGETARVIGFYLAKDGEGDIAGMDGVIGFFLSNSESIEIAVSVVDFAQRMFKSYFPELSEGSKIRLIKEARKGKNRYAFHIGEAIFGSAFKRWTV